MSDSQTRRPSRSNSESALLLGVVRSEGQLLAVVSQRRVAAANAAEGYAVMSVPVRAVDQRLLAEKPRLCAAWERLCDVAAFDGSVLADVLTVLLSTAPAAFPDIGPLLRLTSPPPLPRRTAGHPRAFKGTKYRPPKWPRPAVLDLRSALCSRRNTYALLEHLWPWRAEALAQLARLRFDEAGLARLARCPTPPLDPYLLFHHGGSPTPAKLAPLFVEWILPALAGASWPIVRRAASLFEQLRLADERHLAALGARLVRVASAERALEWWEALGGQPGDRRSDFFALVLDTGAWTESPARVSEALVDLGHGAKAERYKPWALVLLAGLARKLNPAYLAAGIRFAVAYAPNWWFGELADDAPDFGPGTAAALLAALPAEWDGDLLMSLWDTCGAVPGFATLIEQAGWRTLSPSERTYLLRFFTDLRWHQDRHALDPRRWRAIEPFLPRIEELARTVPTPYTDQAMNDLGELVAQMDTPKHIRDCLPLALDLLARVNRPPFCDDGNMVTALSNLLRLPERERGRVLGAPESSFRQLDRACLRRNAASLVAWGMSTLVAHAPALVADAFASAPVSLFRTAKDLGVLSWEARRELMRRCLALGVFECQVERCRLEKMLQIIDTVDAARSMVPRALRDHWAGRRVLSDAQVGRHQAKLRQRLPEIRLAAIRSAVVAHLERSIGLQRTAREALEALELLQQAEGNRRGLRRFLRAHLAGDPDYLLRHPATVAWARRHPRIDLATWTHGIDHHFTTGGRAVSIRVERDPLEVLKLGTYVGSCLGLGGSFASSAAAVVLDINKQVLYARDDRNTVLARQLVAISDADQLVPFSVYPSSTPAGLLRAFREADRKLAAALAIEQVSANQRYSIENVLSREWWDDGAWPNDRDATDDGQTPRALTPRSCSADTR